MRGMPRKIIACLLVLLMLFMGCGFTQIASFFVPVVYATENVGDGENLNQIDEQSDEDVAIRDQSIDKTKLVEDQCDEYTTVFLNDDGTNTARFYSSPVRYEDEEGHLTDIDVSLTELTEGAKMLDEGIMKYKTKASPVDTYLPEILSENSPIVVKYKDYSITLLPITSGGKIDKTDLKEDASEIEKELAKEEKKAVSVNNGNTKTEEVTDLYDEKSEKKTAITYSVLDENNENVIDYEYIPDQFGVKENIILYQKPETNVFEFYLEVKGCYAELDEYGEVVIYDRKTDEIVGSVPAPYMIDADGKENKEEAYFESVHYELIEKAEGKYYLNVVVSEDYLDDPNTAYPVIIDPSVTMVGSSQVYDAYVMSNGWANYNFYSSDVRIMRCGYSGSMSANTRTFIQFPTLQSVISQKIITSATIKAWEWDNSPPYAIMTFYRVTGSWSPSSITYNNQPGNSSFSCGTSTATGSASHTWDVKRVVAWWANGTYSNYGIMLRATVESSSVYNRVDLYGSRTTATSYRPYLAVTYQSPTTLSTPVVTSGGVNSGYCNVSIPFSQVTGASKYILYIKGYGGSTISRDITNEITLNSTTYTWNSSGKTIFSGYTGFPNSSATVLSGTGAYQFYIQAQNSYGIGVNSATKTVTMTDTTAPNVVSTPSLTEEQDTAHVGKATLTVTFNKVTDLPLNIDSGISSYKIKVYKQNIDSSFTQVGGVYSVPYNGSLSTYTTAIDNIDDDAVYKISVSAYDTKGNYSALSYSSQVTVGDYSPAIYAESDWGIVNNVIVDLDSFEGTIDTAKWAIGEHDIAYFAQSGNVFEDGTFQAGQNGTYTIYFSEDGNESVWTVVVNHVTTNDSIGVYSTSATDISVSSVGFDVDLGRSYNSKDISNGIMGIGWTFSYDMNLGDVTYSYVNDNDQTQNVTVSDMKYLYMPDNSVVTFLLTDAENGIYTTFNSELKLQLNTDSTYTLIYDNSTEYHFTADGYLDQIEDKYGNTQSFTLDASGIIQSITDTVNRTYTIGYTNGKITSITDPANRTYTYAYTGDYLTTVTDPMGYVTTYTYTNGLLSMVENGLSNPIVAMSYDANGLLSSIINAPGDVLTYTYDTLGNAVTTTDSKNNQIVYTLDENNYLISIDNDAETISYNAFGQILSDSEAEYTYNENGDATTITYTTNNSTQTFTYNVERDILTSTDQDGIVTFYEYNAYHDVILIAEQKSGTTIDYNPSVDPTLFNIAIYTYYTNGSKHTETAPDATETTYTYDAYGNMLTAISVRNSEIISSSTYTYNTIGWGMTESVTSAGDTKTKDNVYDLNGTLIRTKNEDNEYTRYVYDAAGQLIQKINHEDYNATDDGLNDTPIAYTYANANVGERYIYDVYANVLRHTNSNGAVTRYVYDASLRLVQKVMSDQYDPADDGLPASSSYADNTVGYRYTYDDQDHLLREATPDGKVTRYVYDTNGNMVHMITWDQYNLSYDGLNESTPVDTYSDASVGYRYIYDSNDNLLRSTDPDGNVTRYVYDQYENLLQQINPSQYNASYDGLNETAPIDSYSDNTVGFRYTYFDSGSVETITTPDNSVFTFTTDDSVSTQMFGSITNTFSYNDDGTLDTITNTNGYSLTYSYDELGYIVSYDEIFGSNEYEFCYTYDSDGKILTVAESSTEQARYTYDEDKQLIRVDSVTESATFAYTYNDRGNITSKNVYTYTTQSDLSSETPTDTIVYSYTNVDDPDQLTSYDGLVISYNAVGDMIDYNDMTYVWSTDSELTQIKNTATDEVLESYTYNPNGIRTSKTVGSITTTYTLQGSLIDAETTNGVTVNYVYNSDDSPIYFEVSDGATTDQYWYETNAQGDVIGIVDDSNNEVVTYTYDTWGKLLNIGGSLASTVGMQNHLLYRGYYYDSETGMYYLQSRYYDPELCRFISRDDISYHEGETGAAANLYAYCNNDPVNYTDRAGHFGTPIQWVCAIIGGIAGWFFGDYVAKKLGYSSGWKYWAIRAGVTVGGAVIGWFAGGVMAAIIKGFIFSSPSLVSRIPVWVYKFLGVTTGTVVLGRYPTYLALAQKLGSSVFSIASNVWNKLSAAAQWALNRAFLDKVISSGQKITLSFNAYKAQKGTYFYKEIEYLLSKGYKIVKYGWELIKK